jgi:hypothetical protein
MQVICNKLNQVILFRIQLNLIDFHFVKEILCAEDLQINILLPIVSFDIISTNNVCYSFDLNFCG